MTMTEAKPITYVIAQYLEDTYGNQDLIIFGMGREGLSTYRFLRTFFPEKVLLLLDEKPLTELDPQWYALLDHDPQATVLVLKSATYEHVVDALQSGKNQMESLESAPPHSGHVTLFKTPGATSEHPLIQSLLKHGAALCSNTVLCFDLLKLLPNPPITIGVTGTKGKSTTASLIHHVLHSNQRESWLAGNIGIPPLEVLKKLLAAPHQSEHDSSIVFELSSHQLRELTQSPHIAVVLNITPEHLDYYADFKSYQTAKRSITAYQNQNDVVIYNPEMTGATAIAQLSHGIQRTYAVEPVENPVIAPATEPSKVTHLTAYADQTALFLGVERVMDRSSIPLLGSHNLLNVLPAVLVGHELGLSNEQIATAIASFKPLPHRLEFVAEVHGVHYINDSQATTPEATIAALASFSGKKITLIAGGSDKGVDLQPVAEAVFAHAVQTLILFPPTGETLAHLVNQQAQKHDLRSPAILHAKSMIEAVKLAAESSQKGDIVLLSPACASFGMFENYIDRGNQFKAAVSSLAT